MYLHGIMAPKGNRSERRGHRLRVGGPNSKRTINASVRLPVETVNRILRKVGKTKGALSNYIRRLIDRDLRR